MLETVIAQWITSRQPVLELKINTFWLLYYVDAVFRGNKQFEVARGVEYNPDVGRVWFDDIVVATRYIGPVTAVPKGSK